MESAFNYTIWNHGDGDKIVSSQPVVLRAIIESAALTGDVTLRDGTTASGTSLGVYSATTEFYDMRLANGLFIDDNATAGQIIVVWRGA